MATFNEKMTAIADEIRNKTEGTEKLTLDDIKESIPQVYEKGASDFEEDFLNSAW